MNQEQTHFDWSFGLQWMAACTLGILVGGTVAIGLMWPAGAAVEAVAGEMVGILTVGLLFGSIFALGANLGPGLLLQRRGVNAGRWIGVSMATAALAVGVGFTAVFSIMDMDTMPQPMAAVVIGLLLGLPLGVGQWLVLRGHGLAAYEWLLISPAAYLAAFIVGLPLGGEGRELLSVGVVGLLVSVLTGLGMVWLWRRATAVVA